MTHQHSQAGPSAHGRSSTTAKPNSSVSGKDSDDEWDFMNDFAHRTQESAKVHQNHKDDEGHGDHDNDDGHGHHDNHDGHESQDDFNELADDDYNSFNAHGIDHYHGTRYYHGKAYPYYRFNCRCCHYFLRDWDKQYSDGHENQDEEYQYDDIESWDEQVHPDSQERWAHGDDESHETLHGDKDHWHTFNEESWDHEVCRDYQESWDHEVSADDDESSDDKESGDDEDESRRRREEALTDAALERLLILLIVVLLGSRAEPLIQPIFLLSVFFLFPLCCYLDHRRIALQEDKEPGTDDNSRGRKFVSDEAFKALVTFLIIAVVGNDYGWKAVLLFLLPFLFVLSLPADRRGVTFERALTFPRINLPRVQIPDIQLPDIQLPDVQLPDLKLPDIDLSRFDLSRFSIPQINLPRINLLPDRLPRDDLPRSQLPRNPVLVYFCIITIWALIMHVIRYVYDYDNPARMDDLRGPNVTKVYLEHVQEVVILLGSNATVAVLSPHSV